MSHRIVFLDRATIAPQIRVRPPSFAHELIEHAETRADQVVERLAGASHWVHHDEAERVNQLLSDFFAPAA